MRLELPDTPVIENPSEEQIRAAIDRLDERNEDPFIILSRAPDKGFMQAIGGPHAFQVEYKDAGTGRLYQSAVRLPKPTACDLFAAYIRGDDTFKSTVDWRDITDRIPKRSDETTMLIGLILLIVLLLVVVGFYLFALIRNLL